MAERVGEWVDVRMEVFSRSSQLAMKGYGEEFRLIRSVSQESWDILTLLGVSSGIIEVPATGTGIEVRHPKEGAREGPLAAV